MLPSGRRINLGRLDDFTHVDASFSNPSLRNGSGNEARSEKLEEESITLPSNVYATQSDTSGSPTATTHRYRQQLGLKRRAKPVLADLLNQSLEPDKTAKRFVGFNGDRIRAR